MTVRKLRIVEFLVIGLAMGITEDLIAIKSATGARIDFNVFWIAFLVAFPFAVISELVVDHPNFWKKIMKFPKIEIRQAKKKIEEKLPHKH